MSGACHGTNRTDRTYRTYRTYRSYRSYKSYCSHAKHRLSSRRPRIRLILVGHPQQAVDDVVHGDAVALGGEVGNKAVAQDGPRQALPFSAAPVVALAAAKAGAATQLHDI